MWSVLKLYYVNRDILIVRIFCNTMDVYYQICTIPVFMILYIMPPMQDT